MRAGVAVRVRCGLDTCEEYASVQLAVASWVEAARQHGALEVSKSLVLGALHHRQYTVL